MAHRGTPGARFTIFILVIILFLIVLLVIAGRSWRTKPSTPLQQSSTWAFALLAPPR